MRTDAFSLMKPGRSLKEAPSPHCSQHTALNKKDRVLFSSYLPCLQG